MRRVQNVPRLDALKINEQNTNDRRMASRVTNSKPTTNRIKGLKKVTNGTQSETTTKKNKKRKSVTLRALLGLSAQQATSAASFPGCGVGALTACARQCMSSHRWWTIARRCCQINFSSRRAGTLKPRKNVLFAERHLDKNAFLVILFSFQQNRCACACTSAPAFAGVQL